MRETKNIWKPGGVGEHASTNANICVPLSECRQQRFSLRSVQVIHDDKVPQLSSVFFFGVCPRFFIRRTEARTIVQTVRRSGGVRVGCPLRIPGIFQTEVRCTDTALCPLSVNARSFGVRKQETGTRAFYGHLSKRKKKKHGHTGMTIIRTFTDMHLYGQAFCFTDRYCYGLFTDTFTGAFAISVDRHFALRTDIVTDSLRTHLRTHLRTKAISVGQRKSWYCPAPRGWEIFLWLLGFLCVVSLWPIIFVLK